ncbi:MAG: DNA topoisomerase [Phycisphaerae bacterium]
MAVRTLPDPRQDPAAAARYAGLRYVTDTQPGIRRVRQGRGFGYKGADGRPLKAPDVLARIRSLVIPPAWTDVWICPHANGHIQAIGRDDRGRKQYRYHDKWREVGAATKFHRMAAFGKALPAIRRIIARHMRLPGLKREKVLATVVHLLDETHIRVGNDEYAAQNNSFGLTTLRDRHVKVSGARVQIRYQGKSGKRREVQFSDARLARIIKRCQDLPGQELFQYVDDAGQTCDVESADVNDYVRDVTGEDFTAKDFRTWAGTVLVVEKFLESGPCTSKTAGRKQIVQAIKEVAARLGNTPSVCRNYYIHPYALRCFEDGSLFEVLVKACVQKRGGRSPDPERVVMALLRRAARCPDSTAPAVPARKRRSA